MTKIDSRRYERDLKETFMELLKSKKLKTEALSDVKEKESIGSIASITLLSIA